MLIVTTPNRDFNVIFETVETLSGKQGRGYARDELSYKVRHDDHRFEYTREEFQEKYTDRLIKLIIERPKRHWISDTMFHLRESVHLKMPSTGVQSYLINTLIFSHSDIAHKSPYSHVLHPGLFSLQHQNGGLWKPSFIINICATYLHPSHPILKPSQRPSVPCGDNSDQSSVVSIQEDSSPPPRGACLEASTRKQMKIQSFVGLVLTNYGTLIISWEDFFVSTKRCFQRSERVLMAWRLIVVLFSDSQTDDRIRWVGDIWSVIEGFSLCRT